MLKLSGYISIKGVHTHSNQLADIRQPEFAILSVAMAGKCSKCKTECVFKESKTELFGFPCDVCGGILCKNCADLSATEIRFIAMSSRAVPYLCKECIGLLRQIPSLKIQIRKLEQEVQELKCAANSAKQSYADVLKVSMDNSDELKNTIKDLEMKVQNVSKPETPQAGSGVSQLEPAVQEMQEREYRAANILLFGVKESDTVTKDERITQENKTVEEILQRIDSTVTREIKVRRLGKYEPQKVRPIKVTFPSKAIALGILKQRSKLSSNEAIYIKSDQTVNQRNYLKAIIAEMETRIQEGEQNLRIKYVNSVPKIIKTSGLAKKN